MRRLARRPDNDTGDMRRCASSLVKPSTAPAGTSIWPVSLGDA